MSFFGEEALNDLFGDRGAPEFPQSSRQPQSPIQLRAVEPAQIVRGGERSITPLACADIDYLPSSAAGFSMNGHRASLVSLVGVVRDSKPNSFILDDRTGGILCSSASLGSHFIGQERRLDNGDYARVIGEVEREILPNVLGGSETGGFIFEVVHTERLKSMNAISDHMLLTVRAKLSYITRQARYRKEFNL